MKDFGMVDHQWYLSEEELEKLDPELEPEQRVEAAESLSRYFKVIGKIYDHLDDEGKLKDTLLRIQCEKRNRTDSSQSNRKKATTFQPPFGTRTNSLLK